MQNQEKKVAGEAAAELVKSGMTIGIGTGSTVAFFLEALKEKTLHGMKIRGVPTSERTAVLCHLSGIEVLDICLVGGLDLTVDSADEIDSRLRMIKGGGGALLREKIVAEISQKVVIIADSTKLVEHLGVFPVPVEVVRFGYQQIQRRFSDLGITATLRSSNGIPYTTDNGNYILDCNMGFIHDPEALATQLKATTGVVDSGLFINHCHTLIVGKGTRATFRFRES